LVKHVTLSSSTVIFLNDEGFGGPSWPCIDALREFGPEVVAPLLRMYVAPATTDDERAALKRVLGSQSVRRTRQMTLEEIRAFGRTLKNRSERERLVAIYSQLHRGYGDVLIPDDWPRFDGRTPEGGPSRPLDHLADRLKSSG
jgi:hypothetical protein